MASGTQVLQLLLLQPYCVVCYNVGLQRDVEMCKASSIVASVHQQQVQGGVLCATVRTIYLA
jgi:hypothetical protein